MRTRRRIGLLVTGLAVVSLLLGSSAGPSPVVAASPPAPTVVATIPVGRDAAGIAVDATGIWVTGWHANTLSRIDPATNAVAAEITLPLTGSAGPEAIASGLGSLWVTTTEWNDADTTVPGSLLRVDPASGAVKATVPIGRNSLSVAAGSAVWVVNVDDQTITRIDPATNTVAATIPLTGVVTVAAAGDAVWAGTKSGSVVRIDPATNAVAKTVTTDAKYPLVALGDGVVWATSDAVGSFATSRLLRIDPAAGSVVATIPLAGTETGGIAVAGGSVWIALWNAPSVLQVDPAQNAVVATVPVTTPFGQGIAATATSAWLLGYVTEPFVGDPSPSGIVTRISMGPPPVPSSVAWTAKVGVSGKNGTAVLTSAGSKGTLRLALKGLVPSAAYPVKVMTGTCARPGSTLWSAPTQKATAAGRIAKSLAIPAAKAVAIRAAGSTGPVSVRIGSGSRLRCGLLTAGPAPVATPTPLPTATPVPTPTPTASPAASPTPTATPSPSLSGNVVTGPYFTVTLPAGWTRLPAESDDPEDSVSFKGSHGEACLISSATTTASLDDAMVRAALAMAMVGATVETTESVTIGGKPGKLLTGHATIADTNSFVMIGVTVANGRLYLFVMIGDAKYEAASKTALLGMFSTFGFRTSP